MKVMYTGNITISTPSTSVRCEIAVAMGRFSIIWGGVRLVVNPLLDVAELDDRERHQDAHQHHRLRGRGAEVERLEAVEVHLVDEDRRVLARAAPRGRIDDREGLDEDVDDVDDEQEEG